MKSQTHTVNKIALIVGHNLSGLLIANDLIPQMKEAGLEPVLYMAKYSINEEKAQPALKSLFHYESTILRETVYPLLNEQESGEALKRTFARTSNGHAHQNQHAYTPQQLSQIHDIQYKELENVNSPEFIEEIKNDPELLGGLSVRNYQIFRKDIISAFDKKGGGFLWNLHPGILPEYRGLMAPLRAMMNNDRNHGWSLHVVDEGIDTGPLIYQKETELDYSATVFEQYLNLAPLCKSFIVDQIQMFKRHSKSPSLRMQKKIDAQCYTYPTRQELRMSENAGICLFEPGEMIQTLVSEFSSPGTNLEVDLRHAVTAASTAWEKKQILNSGLKASNMPLWQPEEQTLRLLPPPLACE